MTTPARVALMGGMGYPATETTWGMPRLKARLEAIGAQVLLVSWSARTEVRNFMYRFNGRRLYAGDSLGGGSAGEYPKDVDGEIDYAAGFQPSDYDARSHDHIQIIASNIRRAHCVFDPYWIDTGGLGHTRWQITPGSGTKLLLTEHRGAHPDDWGISQDMIFNDMKAIIEA